MIHHKTFISKRHCQSQNKRIHGCELLSYDFFIQKKEFGLSGRLIERGNNNKDKTIIFLIRSFIHFFFKSLLILDSIPSAPCG
jgi:hypothetical protein